MSKIKILFLSANPVNTDPLRLGEEVRAIDEELLKARFRDKFDLEQKHAVKAEDLSQHLLRVEPDIVHFSGHGSRAGQIHLEDANGESHPVGERALSNLFSVLKGNIRCVVLNACYSEVQAMIITRHIDCVIGMSKAIGDKAAIKFAQGFYRGIGYGKDLKTAYKLGCAQIDLQNLAEQSTPKILWKNDEPKTIVFGQPSLDSKPKFSPQEGISLGTHERIVYCSRCGTLTGQKSLCTTILGFHDFVSGTGTIYCSRCGAQPGQKSLCTTILGFHDFISD